MTAAGARRARLRLQDIKSENQAEQYRRQAEVYARVPEIQRLDGEMREQMTELVRGSSVRRT